MGVHVGDWIKPLSSIMQDNEWAGRRAFIVGGGPSLKGFDFSALQGELVVAINRAYTCGIATLVCGADRGFWESFKHDPLLWEHPRKVFLSDDNWDMPCNGVYRVKMLEMFNWGKSLSRGVGAGPDSGYRTLNLVDVLGASPIGLLGFDMDGHPDGRQAWWHEGYPRRQHNVVYDRFRGAYKDAVNMQVIKSKVYNLNSGSRLEAFPKIGLSEFMKLPVGR